MSGRCPLKQFAREIAEAAVIVAYGTVRMAVLLTRVHMRRKP